MTLAVENVKLKLVDDGNDVVAGVKENMTESLLAAWKQLDSSHFKGKGQIRTN